MLGSELLVLALALRMLLRPLTTEEPAVESLPKPSRLRVVGTVAAVAFASGLLANSGGFLLAPLFVAVLHMPLKRALGTSLGISLALAIPGTIVHAALGHVHWPLTIAFGIASVPFRRGSVRTSACGRVHAGWRAPTGSPSRSHRRSHWSPPTDRPHDGRTPSF